MKDFYLCNFNAVFCCLFSLRENIKSCCQVYVYRAHPKDKGVMLSLRQLKVVAVLGTWDPCLSAGIGVEPAASLRARCCFIYLKAQVTFLEEHHRDLPQRAVCFPRLLSHTSQWRMGLRANSQVRLRNVTETDSTWTFTFYLTLRLSASISVTIQMNTPLPHCSSP